MRWVQNLKLDFKLFQIFSTEKIFTRFILMFHMDFIKFIIECYEIMK